MGLADRIQVIKSDMRSLEPLEGGLFNMAFCALNTFAYLQTSDDQLLMLRSAHRTLVQHGILILDLTPPLSHLLPPAGGEVVYQGSFDDAETGDTLHKFVTGYAAPARQSHYVQMIYDLQAPDGTLRRYVQSQVFRWAGRYEMELLLRAASYKLEKIYGSYDLDEFTDDSERMIFVARAD
jgi:hypothetical protein